MGQLEVVFRVLPSMGLFRSPRNDKSIAVQTNLPQARVRQTRQDTQQTGVSVVGSAPGRARAPRYTGAGMLALHCELGRMASPASTVRVLL